MSTALLNDFGYTIKNLRVRVFGRDISHIETEVISAQSSVMNTVTAQPGDYNVVENHPFIPVYGRFRNDPTWDRFMLNIEEYNQEVDAIERSRE